jgi:hypothetical protein
VIFRHLLAAVTGRDITQLWKGDLGNAIRWSPVAHSPQIFVMTEHNLVVLDGDGTELPGAFPQGLGHAAAARSSTSTSPPVRASSRFY